MIASFVIVWIVSALIAKNSKKEKSSSKHRSMMLIRKLEKLKLSLLKWPEIVISFTKKSLNSVLSLTVEILKFKILNSKSREWLKKLMDGR